MKISRKAIVSLFLATSALAGCNKADPGAKPDPAQGGALVRVQVPEAKCEVAIPANMTIAKAKASGFTIVEKGKDPGFDGMLIVIMPMASKCSVAPPDATDVKIDKDTKGPDGSVACEGSYRNAYQTLHVAEYVYPIGTGNWLYCKISAAKAERRDDVARLCRGLAPKAL
jgi:hypothetical protein